MQAETSPTQTSARKLCAFFLFIVALQALLITAITLRGADFASNGILPLISVVLLHVIAFFSLYVAWLLWYDKPHGKKFWQWVKKQQGMLRPLQRFLFPIICALIVALTTLQILTVGTRIPFLNLLLPLPASFLLSVVLDLLLIWLVRWAGKQEKKNRSTLFLILGSLAFVWLFIVITRIGLEPDSHFWNVAGVPVLLNQVAAILLASWIAERALTWVKEHWFADKPKLKWIPEFVLCLLLMLTAFLMWRGAPFSNSYFARPNGLPDNNFYPFSDSVLSDLGGQYMLIGERLEYPYFTEKPLYVIFSGLLHLVAGQDYLRVTALQILVFSIMPVLLYCLGKHFGNTLFGLALAGFSIVKEYNALFITYKVSVTNSRLLMTELPIAIVLIGAALLVYEWFRRPNDNSLTPLWAGGVLGLAALLRTNPLLIIPILLAFSFLIYRSRWKSFLRAGALFVAGIALVIAPWVIYNRLSYGIDPYTYKIDSVYRTRFLNLPPQPAPTGIDVEATYLYRKVHPESSQPLKLLAQTLPKHDAPARSSLNWILSHFLNNEIKALFILPFQLGPLELTPVIDQVYWQEPVIWQGELPLETIIAFGINLILITLGIFWSWQRHHLAGLVPLLFNLGYYLANGFARTSGSRYLLPVDWTVWFYYLAGILAIVFWVKNKNVQPQDQPPSRGPARGSLLLALAVLLVMGTAIPLINVSFPKQYNKLSKMEAFELVPLELIDEEILVSPAQLKLLRDRKNGEVVFGKALYPRYEIRDGSEEKGYFITVLMPELREVFIPNAEPPLYEVPGGGDVVVIGCNRGRYLEGVAAYFVDSGQLVYTTKTYFDSNCE